MPLTSPSGDNISFTHVDPFEDTESHQVNADLRRQFFRFTHVDPFEDTERPCRATDPSQVSLGFTHVDPFEDTESENWRPSLGRPDNSFHPRRSVRGY